MQDNMQDNETDNGFAPAPAGRVFMLPLIATVTLALSTLAILAAVSSAAHAGAIGVPMSDGSFHHVLGVMAGGLGGYAALRALQRD